MKGNEAALFDKACITCYFYEGFSFYSTGSTPKEQSMHGRESFPTSSAYFWLPTTRARGTVIALHGMWGNALQWGAHSWPQALNAARWRVYAVDAPGRRDSRERKMVSTFGIEDYARAAQDVVERVQKLHPDEPIVLMGQSLGGFVAQKLSFELPVSGVVLLASAVDAGLRQFRTRMRLAIALKAPLLFTQKPFLLRRQDLKRLLFSHVRGREQRAFLSRLQPDSARIAREIALRRVRIRDEKFPVPVCAFVPLEDRVLKPDVQIAELQARGAEIRLIKMGHMPHLEPRNETLLWKVLLWTRQFA